MSRLRLYVDDRGRSAMHESGFSWLAGIAIVYWALQRRLYGLAAFSVLYGLGFSFLTTRLGPGMQFAALAMQVAIVGALANPLHRWLLEKRGWLVTAEEPETGSGKTA